MYMQLGLKLSLCGEGKSVLDFTDHSCFKLLREEGDAVYA